MKHLQLNKTAKNAQQRTAPVFATPVLSVHSPIHPLLHFQQTLGNRALGRFIQAKLTVNAPGDIYEQEANRVAEQVMRMPEPFPAMSSNEHSPPALQRKCAACASGQGLCPQCAEEEEMVQRKPLAAPIATLVQRQMAAGATPGVSPSVESHIHSLRGGGHPLPESARTFFEPRFGYDFSQVRVHANQTAAQSASGVNALAYTVGPHMVFGSGQYAPTTTAGRRLIAHELTHVVQQSGLEGIRAGQSNEGNGLSPISLPISPSSPPVIQRDEPPKGTGEEGRALTVVIRAPDDKYTQNVTDYVRNTLNDKNIIEVDNLQEVFPYLEKIKKSKGPKLKKIRLIAHGSTIGGIKMKLPGKGKREFVNPAELEKMAQDQNLQTIAAGAMEGDATVEFYGCYVGGEPTTEAAISTMFQSEFRSPDEALHTEEATFVWNRKTVTSSAAVDEAAKKDKKAKTQFEDWLLKQHKQLVAAGDIPDAGTKADKIAAMRDLFDRSKGRIKQLIIEKRGGEKVRPSQKGPWASEWRKWNVKGSSQ